MSHQAEQPTTGVAQRPINEEDARREKYDRKLRRSVELWEKAEPVKMVELRVKALRTLRLADPPKSRLGVMVYDARYTEMVRAYRGWPTFEEWSST